jgi:hypothetical protein
MEERWVAVTILLWDRAFKYDFLDHNIAGYVNQAKSQPPVGMGKSNKHLVSIWRDYNNIEASYPHIPYSSARALSL